MFAPAADQLLPVCVGPEPLLGRLRRVVSGAGSESHRLVHARARNSFVHPDDLALVPFRLSAHGGRPHQLLPGRPVRSTGASDPAGRFVSRLLFFPACRTHRNDRKSLQIFLATFAGIILPYLLWKLWYFHQLLPNTFYAKTGGDAYVVWRGAAYIIQGWGVSEALLFLIAITGVFATFHRHSVMNRRNDIPLFDAKSVPERRVRAVALGFTFLFLIYILAVGGDSLGRDRFLAPLLPFVLAAAISSEPGLPKRRSAPLRWGLALLFCGILIGNSMGLTDRIRNPDVYSYRKELNHPGTITGRCLAEHAGHRDTIATSIIGRIPYYSGLRTFDVFGLIDPFIARQQSDAIGSGAAGHEKSDWSYILSLKPLYITGQELIAAPPAEPDWLRALRLRIHGDRAGRQIGIPAPPYPGYSRVELICGESTIRIWKRTPELLMEMDEQENGRAE